MRERTFSQQVFPRREVLTRIGLGVGVAALFGLTDGLGLIENRRVISVPPTSDQPIPTPQPTPDRVITKRITAKPSNEDVDFFKCFIAQELRQDHDRAFWSYLNQFTCAQDIIDAHKVSYWLEEVYMDLPLKKYSSHQWFQHNRFALFPPDSRVIKNPTAIMDLVWIKDMSGKVVYTDLIGEIDNNANFAPNTFNRDFTLAELDALAPQIFQYAPRNFTVLPQTNLIQAASEDNDQFIRYQLSQSGRIFITCEAK